MKTKTEYIDLIQSNNEVIRGDFGVKSLRVFGSVARGENNEGSDVDVCVEMPSKMMLMLRLKSFLENLLQTSVDVVRMRADINPVISVPLKSGRVKI